MRQITEQQIAALAPNPAAASNGRKLSQSGHFVRRTCSADDTFYLGECTGSGKNNYIVSADFLDPAHPVFRCSCPSRQFPCKHSLGLLYEILAGKPFELREIPDDILQKRAKKEAKSAKETEGATAKPASPPKVNKSARTKKLKKQLEGLELCAKLVRDLMHSGLGTMGGTALSTYRQLAKQLGDYYLPGPQRLLNRLIMEISAFQQDGEDSHYDRAVDVLKRLWALVKKSRQYLNEKLERGDMEQDDSVLYEELGGVWKLAELESLNLSKENVRLAQLAFWVEYDEARAEFIDTGCWADPDSGEISVTYNYRPVKALKYVKQEDTVFGVARVPSAAYYPGDGNRRIRWDSAEIAPLTPADLALLRGHAAPAIAAAAKSAKNLLKNTLSDPMAFQLLSYSRIGKTADGPALQDGTGGTILLGNLPGMEDSVSRLSMLPDAALLENQVMLGAFWYDGSKRRLMFQPLSILTPDTLIRLLY